MTDDGVVERVFGDAAESARRYVAILADKGVAWGLLGPREVPRLWERHVLNSAALAPLLPSSARVVDVGSGAGLPGIPLALARPDLEVTLLEPLLRRATFLRETVADLSLGDRVRVVRARAEDHQETYDVVTCRAVAAVAKLVGWTAHLVPVGQVIALKGDSVEDELTKAAEVLAKHRLCSTVRVVRADPACDETKALILSR